MLVIVDVTNSTPTCKSSEMDGWMRAYAREKAGQGLAASQGLGSLTGLL